MAWNEKRSKERVKKNDFSDLDLNVKDLARSMDFTKLGKKDVRRAEGVHLYVDVPNFHRAVDDAGNDKQKQRKLVRASSVLRRIQGSLMSDDDVGDIQRQTVRAHGLVFKPYNGKDEPKDAERAKQAVIHAITQNTYVLDVFNSVFSDVRDFSSAAGLASGTSYVCNIGKNGKRELISLGTCANLSAKIIGGRDSITITAEMYDVLPKCLQDEFVKDKEVSDVQTYRATGIRWGRNSDLADELGVDWDEGKWKKETKKHRDNLPLDKITISEATTLIDLTKLTERNCKRTEAVTFYADLDGFTRYVQEAETDEKVISLIRQFHMIRSEFHSVVESDYDGLPLQHRGDCILGIMHLPSGAGKHKGRCNDAVDMAIGLQSSMEHVLNDHLTDREEIHVAIGMDVGKVIVSRLGKQGERITICFGPEVTEAERLQVISKAEQIRIASDIFDELDDEDVTEEFTKRGSAFVATNLTRPKLDEKKEEKAAEAGSLGACVNEGLVRVTTKATAPAARPWHDSKPWRSE
ncbi:adenylate/guanylate cyclase domain-containing protein [Fuerstiella marisgermanici]|uniref:Adenylate and Guanylate cyclase catalytic domain protein n=1 Tax=Fuerstiella marisgermanici TaxID=1891926 RepID=A0A1P8WGY0_9PLAN|nr:adenylate/guanylate cyclase domain-containing protein [Fuerstiella marisgermanici]APZ93312.1 Adenylate and Guanylate cyclase catalytic domain protein [Fuerstiella marisgermanici]